MGYTTTFRGRFNLDKPLAPEHAAYLQAFRDNRRMAATEENALQLDNVGWRGVRSGESVGLWCPPCLAGVVSFVEVASKSDPKHPRKVQIRDYKPVSCNCPGNARFGKVCDHMRQAAKMVGGPR